MLKKLMILTLLFPLIQCAYTSQPGNDLIRQKIEELKPEKREKWIHCIPSLKTIYGKNKYRSLWLDSKKIGAFISEVERAELEGLNPEDYHLSALKRYHAKDMLTSVDKVYYDILLTDAFLLYATHLLSGKVNPTTIDAEWHATKREGDPIRLFNTALKNKKMAAPFKTILSKNEPYLRLKHQLVRYRKIQDLNGWKSIPKGPVISSGKKDSRIPLIRERLSLSGDYKGRKDILSDIYEISLQKAVKNFQKRHGLISSGLIGDETLREMNVSVKKRVEQIKVNLERYRWLPQEFSSYYLLINIADFMLDVIKNQKSVLRQKIIVGKPYKKTPAFSSKIYYLIFNPTWTIPMSIIQSDIIPAIRKNSNYLVQQHITVLDNKRQPVKNNRIEWDTVKLNDYLFRQEPGSHNALGVVKFMFPNPFDIYLHDTPSKILFNRSSRAFSSGCIRLQQPIDLALTILSDQPQWSHESIKDVIKTNNTEKVILTTKPDIHFIYLTAWVDENHILHFRPDIYDRDTSLYAALIKK